MNFKIDENLPAEFEYVLRNSGFETDTVTEECLPAIVAEATTLY